MKIFISLLLLFCLNACSSMVRIVQGGKGDFSWSETQITVPFEEIKGMILVRVILNHTPEERMFLVDTGASVSLISEEIFKELSLEVLEKVPVMGVQKKGELNLTRLKSLQLGGVVFEDLGVVVSSDMKKISDLSEIPIDGILGHNALRFFRVQFDFQQKTLNFYQTPLKNHRLSGIPMHLRWDRGPVIHVELFGKKVEALIDTGSPRVVFPKKWVAGNPFTLAAVKGSVSYGLLGLVKQESFTRVEDLKVSGHAIPLIRAVVLGKASKASEESLLLGTDVLKGFRFTLDYLSGRAEFEPIPGFVFEKSFTRSGVFFIKKEGKIEVAAVVENTPADFLGVLPGDRLILINGKPSESFTLKEISELFSGKNRVFLKTIFERNTRTQEADFFKNPFNILN